MQKLLGSLGEILGRAIDALLRMTNILIFASGFIAVRNGGINLATRNGAGVRVYLGS